MRIFGVVGNCRGKNVLVPQIVRALGDLGISISTLKRVGDDVDIDRPGKASYTQRQAGARQVMIANSFRWALMTERPELTEPDIDVFLQQFAPVDLVLVEGFHLAPIPKCEIVLAGQDRRPSYPDDPSIVAVITDSPLSTTLPCFSPDASGDIAAFIVANACKCQHEAEAEHCQGALADLYQEHGRQRIDA